MKGKLILILLAVLLLGAVSLAESESAPSNNTIPSIGDLLKVADKATTNAEEGKDWSAPIKLVIVFTGLALLPSLLVITTSFTRIVIVMSFARRALGTQNIPPTMAIIGLSLFLTLFTMAPTFSKINTTAVQPYLQETLAFEEAWTTSSQALKEFMLSQCRESALGLFLEMADVRMPENPFDLGMHIVIPAFVISEFQTAFEIGCLLYIPFLLIDLVIANILLSAGMMMMPPSMISMPFKLILFILVDGWSMLAKNLCLGFQ